MFIIGTDWAEIWGNNSEPLTIYRVNDNTQITWITPTPTPRFYIDALYTNADITIELEKLQTIEMLVLFKIQVLYLYLYIQLTLTRTSLYVLVPNRWHQ